MPTYRVRYEVVMGPEKGTIREDSHVLSKDEFAIGMALANEGEDDLIDITNVDTGEVVFPDVQPTVSP